MDNQPNILLVEDSRTQALKLAGTLGAAGLQVKHAMTAEEAMESLGASTPDLILIDYYLPGIRGDALCRQIRARIDTRTIPIVILTGDAGQEIELRGLESGADDFITKSVDDEVLLLRVRALLARSHTAANTTDTPEQVFSGARLLAIDDSATYLAFLVAELASDGYVVHTANHGDVGLKRLTEEPFDCVLVDLVMPEMDGIDVCRRIQEVRSQLQRAPMVLMLTSSDDNRSLARALEAGADDFVGKSSDIIVIKGRIRSLLRRRFYEEEHRRRLSAELRTKQLEAEQARLRQQALEERAALLENLKHIADALRCSDAELCQLAMAVRGSSDGMWSWNTENNEMWFAPRFKELLEYEADELPNQFESWNQGLHPDDREEVLAAMRLHAGQDAPLDVVCRFRTKTGRYRWFRVRGRAAQPDANGPVRMAGSIQDVTNLHETEDELRMTAAALAHSNKDLEEFAYAASHDLRAPLRAITNLANWIKDDMADRFDDENRNRLDLLISRALRLDRLIEDLLEYSRAGRVLGKVTRTDVSELVEEIVELLSPAEGFEIARSSPLPVLNTACVPLQQILRNLIQNAIKHHDQQTGRIDISARSAGSFIEFVIADDGPGIPIEFRERIFGLFETLKPRDVVEGSGIGLAVVKRTVEKLGGTITVEPNEPRGTTFRFTWPIDLAEQSGAPAQSRMKESKSNFKPEHATPVS